MLILWQFPEVTNQGAPPGHSYTVLAARENGPTLVVPHVGAGCTSAAGVGVGCTGAAGVGVGWADVEDVGADCVGTTCVGARCVSVIGVGCAAGDEACGMSFASTAPEMISTRLRTLARLYSQKRREGLGRVKCNGAGLSPPVGAGCGAVFPRSRKPPDGEDT